LIYTPKLAISVEAAETELRIAKKLNPKPITLMTVGLAVLSGLLMTAAFPDIGFHGAAWFALLPLLFAVNGLSWFNRFRIGLLAGLVHSVTLVYWAAYTLNTYGNLPWFLSISIMLLFALYLSLYPAVFSTLLSRLPKNPVAVCKSSEGLESRVFFAHSHATMASFL